MKNQKGVSLITLIITIIVVIILAVIVLRSGASDAPDQANFSKFTSEMGELQDAMNLAMLTAKGEEQLKGNQRTEAQLYNFIARGGYEGFEWERNQFDSDNDPHDFIHADDITDDEKWLTQVDAEGRITSTKINEDFAEEMIGMKLPERKVETAKGVGQKMSYFVTPKGIVFCWPPYVYDGKSYVNANTTVKMNSYVDEGKGIVSGDEMKETEATEKNNVTIVFENGEYVKVENSKNDADYIQTVDSYGIEDRTKYESSVIYTEEGVDGIRFRIYDNSKKYIYSTNGKVESPNI